MSRRARPSWVAVVGARPNYVKLAPLVEAARAAGRDLAWIDTGQHADAAMSRALWRDLRLPPPLASLAAPPPGRGRAHRMARAVREPLARAAPSLVVVTGDTDSTVAGALAAHHLGLPIAHVEAGLRSFERDLPEERNRVRVDRLSAVLHVTEPSGERNLRREGVPRARVHAAGNVMADALCAARGLLGRTRLPASVPEPPWVVATLHRQATVDDPARLARWVSALEAVGRRVPVVFPVHPRTRTRLSRRARRSGVTWLEPLPYLAFLALLSRAAAVVTDSGGVQVEASLLGVPCVTARPRTEHLLTLEAGTNRLMGADPRRLSRALEDALARPRRAAERPWWWDGRAAERIVARWSRERIT